MRSIWSREYVVCALTHPKHRTRWHLHVPAQLQILCECQSLTHSDVSISLEQHHGNGTAREHVPDDEFREYVQAELDVCHGLDDADWDAPEEGNDKSDKNTPPGHMGWVAGMQSVAPLSQV